MTISYHLRPPHPAYIGFDDKLQALDDQALRKTLQDYEQYRLDLATGEIQRDQPGGYTLVAQIFGRPPTVCVSTQTRDRRIKTTLDDILRPMGARMII